jgi:hypothetical protein
MLCFVIFRILVDRAKSRDPVIFWKAENVLK